MRRPALDVKRFGAQSCKKRERWRGDELLMKVGENWRLFRVRPRFWDAAPNVSEGDPGFGPNHTPTSRDLQYYVNTPGVMCAQWLCKHSIYIPFKRQGVSRRIFLLAPHPHAWLPLTTHLVYPEQRDEIRGKEAVCQPFIVPFRAFWGALQRWWK